MASPCVDGEYFGVDPVTGVLTIDKGSIGLREVIRYGTGTHQFDPSLYPWLAYLVVECQGAGGGSAGARSLASTNSIVVTAGAAAGGYSRSFVRRSEMSNVVTVVVGQGGIAGGPATDGNTGGASSFGGFCQANGGDGSNQVIDAGNATQASSGTPGPLAGIGNIFTMGGGPGGGAIKVSDTDALSGQGGASHLGQGGTQRASNGANNGRGSGGGGGGAFARGGFETSGVDGQDGTVIVYLYG